MSELTPGPSPESDAAHDHHDVVWHRLHPRMLLLHPFRAAVDLAPVVIVALVAGTDVSDLRLVLGVAGGLVVLSLLRWWSTTYAVLAGSVDQRRGIVVRRRLSVPLHRIRSADVEAQLLQRLLGLRILRLTTASSMSGHPGHGVVLNAVAPAVAERLAADLASRAGLAVAHGADERGDADPHDAGSLVPWRPWWAVYAPFSAGGFVALGGLGIIVAQFAGDIGAGGTITRAYLAVYDRIGWEATVAVLLGGALLLSAVLAAANYLLVNGRFTVERSGGVLRIHRGLLSRRAVTLDLAKLRGVETQAALPVRLLGGTSTQAIVTGLGILDQAATSTLTPLAPRRVGEQVAKRLLGESPVPEQLPRHGGAAARRRVVRAVGGLAALATLAYGTVWTFAGDAPSVPRWLEIALAVLTVGAVGVAVDRYRRLGHHVDAQWIRSREGSLLGRSVVLRSDAVIGIAVRQGLTQRRAGLATLTLATAAGKQGYRILDLPARDVVPDVLALQDDWWREWCDTSPLPGRHRA